MSKTTEGTYKGNATLTLNADTKYPFTFGVAKAKAIVADFDAIKAFVAKHDRSQTKPTGHRDPGEDAADRWNEGQR